MFEIWLMTFFVVGSVVSLHRLSSVRSMAGYNTPSLSMPLHFDGIRCRGASYSDISVVQLLASHDRWLFSLALSIAQLQVDSFCIHSATRRRDEQGVSALQTCCLHNHTSKPSECRVALRAALLCWIFGFLIRVGSVSMKFGCGAVVVVEVNWEEYENFFFLVEIQTGAK